MNSLGTMSVARVGIYINLGDERVNGDVRQFIRFLEKYRQDNKSRNTMETYAYSVLIHLVRSVGSKTQRYITAATNVTGARSHIHILLFAIHF